MHICIQSCIFAYIFISMPSFKKKKYTDPVACRHNNNLSKDWYVFFRFKYEGKVYKYKRREGINRIKELEGRLQAIADLVEEIRYDLVHGWSPLLDPKREKDYNPYLLVKAGWSNRERPSGKIKASTKKALYNKYFNK
jgi:hypothetical protein